MAFKFLALQLRSLVLSTQPGELLKMQTYNRFNRWTLFLLCGVFSVAAFANDDWKIAVIEGDIEKLETLYEDDTQEQIYKDLNPELWKLAVVFDRVPVLEFLNTYSCRATKLEQLGLWSLAVKSSARGAINWLSKRRAAGVDAVNADGCNLWLESAERGCVPWLEFLLQHNIGGDQALGRDGYNVWWYGAYFGHPAVIDFLAINKIPGYDLLDGDINLWLVAARYGGVKVLERLLFHNIPGREHTLDDGTNIWMVAASNGLIDVLEWLEANNIPGRESINKRGENIWAVARRRQQVQVLKWLRQNTPEWKENAPTTGLWLVAPALAIGYFHLSTAGK